MHFSRILIATLGLAIALPLSASATELADAAGRYRIDPSSDIGFTVSQVAGGGIKGRFGSFSGEIDIDPGALSRSVVSFELKPESVTTGQDRVDGFLRSGAVFDVEAFPTITFRSTEVTLKADNSAIVDGVLTARGKTHAESFTATLTEQHGKAATFHVVGEILRSPYGMDVGTPIYSNVVKFDMRVRAERD